jgi:acetyl-CoA synthetase
LRKIVNEVRNSKGELLNVTFNIPENFNFAYDVVDVLGREKPDKTALMWCNPKGEEKRLTFSDMMRCSTRRRTSSKTPASKRRQGAAYFKTPL